MLLRIIVVIITFGAINSAPRPYYTSLIETPTSRVHQYFYMGPRVDETLKSQSHENIRQIPFKQPNEPTVYYYHLPQQQQHVYHAQQPQIYGLRQDSPFWQEFWNQITGQGSEGSGETEGTEEETPTEESLEGLIVDSDTNESLTSSKPIKNDEVENSQSKLPESVAATINNQPEDQQNISGNSFDDVRKNLDLANDHETTSSTTRLLNEELNIIVSNNEHSVAPELTNLKQSQIFDIRRKDNEDENRSLDKVSGPMHRLFYKIDDQFYVLSGTPKFYGNIDPRSLMYSLQELQPVMRNNEIMESFPFSSTEATSTFKISVVDEDEGEEKGNEKDNNESVQISARSQLPSEDQSPMKLDEKILLSREELKQDQTAEG